MLGCICGGLNSLYDLEVAVSVSVCVCSLNLHELSPLVVSSWNTDFLWVVILSAASGTELSTPFLDT